MRYGQNMMASWRTCDIVWVWSYDQVVTTMGPLRRLDES